MFALLFLSAGLGWPAVWGAVVAKIAGVWFDRWAGRAPRSWGTAAFQGLFWWCVTAAAWAFVVPPLIGLSELVAPPGAGPPAGWAMTVGFLAALHLTATWTAAVALPSAGGADRLPTERSWRAAGLCAGAAAVWGAGAAAGVVALLWFVTELFGWGI